MNLPPHLKHTTLDLSYDARTATKATKARPRTSDKPITDRFSKLGGAEAITKPLMIVPKVASNCVLDAALSVHVMIQ